ncbi:hypothetical protein BJ875DRAFT_518816 [Amylocarpus encephaloides]|uniref:Uncharacterized protein n=1 Tax=Amylocarpus encephaloides TaxID=45428 RepID=A0A9P7YCY8_9HELO|nr:hypothetical protein BJ875DRAFT_518816 [Amylocarpus encephaloides]
MLTPPWKAPEGRFSETSDVIYPDFPYPLPTRLNHKIPPTKQATSSYTPTAMTGISYNNNGSKTIPLSTNKITVWGHQEEIKIEYWDEGTENDTKLASTTRRNTPTKKQTCKSTKEHMYKVRAENGWGGLANSSSGSIASKVAISKDSNYPIYRGQSAPRTKITKDIGYWVPQIEGHTSVERETERNKVKIDRGLQPHEKTMELIIRQDRVEFPDYGGLVMVDKRDNENYEGASFWKIVRSKIKKRKADDNFGDQSV